MTRAEVTTEVCEAVVSPTSLMSIFQLYVLKMDIS